MPYIDEAARVDLDEPIDALVETIADSPGSLAYAITRLALNFAVQRGYYAEPSRGIKFEDYADTIGVLEATKLELYRQQVATYEDAKRHENGGVIV